jgi:glycine oxidase
VAFQEGAEVLALRRNGAGELSGVELRTAEGERQRLACREAVLACGAWSAQLLPELPLFPVKGQMLSLQGPRQALKRVVFGPGTYLVPREDGLLVVGATSEPQEGFREGLTPDGQRTLQSGIAALVPAANSWPPMERWWGFRPCTPDEGPLLGASSVTGLWLATGHHRNGVLLAAITAELLGSCLAEQGGAPMPSAGQASATASGGEGLSPEERRRFLEAFRWDRFQQGPTGTQDSGERPQRSAQLPAPGSGASA